MNILLYTFIILLLISIILIFILNKKIKKYEINNNELNEKNKQLTSLKKDELKTYFEEEWIKEKKELERKKQVQTSEFYTNTIELENQYKLDAGKYTGEIDKLKVQLEEKEARYNEVNQDLDLYREGKIKEIDSAAAEYKQHQQTIIKNELETYYNEWLQKFNEDIAKISESRENKIEELKQIENELEEERSKRAAINEEIRRRRQVEMEQDFYRIQFSDEDKNDIEILRSIAPRLQHPEAINKTIWTSYYQKPLAELRKRLLPNGDISGIYKITRLKTGEIYCGQSVSLDKRFQEHVKSALGVGTLTSSQLHRVMKTDGVENFTFEILEEVPKDKLKERESYYIDFYDSKNYGLNTIKGEQK